MWLDRLCWEDHGWQNRILTSSLFFALFSSQQCCRPRYALHAIHSLPHATLQPGHLSKLFGAHKTSLFTMQPQLCFVIPLLEHTWKSRGEIKLLQLAIRILTVSTPVQQFRRVHCTVMYGVGKYLCLASRARGGLSQGKEGRKMSD